MLTVPDEEYGYSCGTPAEVIDTRKHILSVTMM
jgi:hypothetical protein